jgi:tetratricopeptide (TPR) repeat protein
MYRNFKLLPWQMMGCAALLLGNGSTAQAQSLPPQPILLAQSTQTTDPHALYEKGDKFYDLGTLEGYQQAILLYKEALKGYEQDGYLLMQAFLNNHIGIIYNALGYQQEALEYFQKALLLFNVRAELSQGITTAYILNNIGTVYDILGEKQQALEHFQQALVQEDHNNISKGISLNNIGRIFSDLGEKQQSLDSFQQALTLFQEEKDLMGEALSLC